MMLAAWIHAQIESVNLFHIICADFGEWFVKRGLKTVKCVPWSFTTLLLVAESIIKLANIFNKQRQKEYGNFVEDGILKLL